MKLVILGPQGSGKGTQAHLLLKKFGLSYFAMGDALRAEVDNRTETGKQIADILGAGKLVPNQITDDLVKQFIESHEDFIIDGYPRNLGQAEFFDKLVVVDAVLILDVPDDIAAERLLARGRSDDNEEAIRTRLRIYHDETEKVVKRYVGKAIRVNGNQTVEEVHDEINAKLKNRDLL